MVEKVWVHNGQRKKGDVLAQLEYARQQLQLERALQLEEKKLAFEDQMMSFNGNSVRQKRIKANILISSGLAATEVAYKEAALEYEHTFVRAAWRLTGMEVKRVTR